MAALRTGSTSKASSLDQARVSTGCLSLLKCAPPGVEDIAGGVTRQNLNTVANKPATTTVYGVGPGAVQCVSVSDVLPRYSSLNSTDVVSR